MDSDSGFVGHRPSFLRRVARQSADVFDNNTGLLLIALSQAFTSLMGVFVKKLNAIEPRVPPAEVIWIRMVMTWAVCIVYMSASGVPSPILGPKEIRLLLAMRGLAGFVGLFGTYYALQYLSLSDTTVLSFLTPMCTAVTGALFLKEDLTGKQALASAFSFVGVVLIARPDFLFGRHSADGLDNEAASGRIVTPGQRLGAVGVALLGVVGLTTAYTTIRAIGKRAHPMHNLAAFALVCIVTAPVAMVVTRTPAVVPDNLGSILMVIAVSACGFAAQMTMTTGLQRETAGRGTMAIYVQVIFAMAFERIFFNTLPNWLSLLGTVIILSSAVYVVVSFNTGERVLILFC
ncbi:drug/metabolite transporter [Trametes versicolor FP-101664 SS1]|uniref:drug/metabolite transporter n=1 Tax=Trametes versicolor (strain FP-101664) TaxID=717944 RepID=UPI0004622D18|nr:drug/metabolite transporter [Trametes versicolor FP-101664 SS1]EIW52928.1 drug/metabolite transporter [Trametes versicolor FP-101664 SS1]